MEFRIKGFNFVSIFFLFFQNLKQWVVGKHEVEVVDMILKVKQKLKICNEISIDGLPQAIIAQNETTRKQLHRHLEDMKRFLPDDLNKILSS